VVVVVTVVVVDDDDVLVVVVSGERAAWTPTKLTTQPRGWGTCTTAVEAIRDLKFSPRIVSPPGEHNRLNS